MNGLSVSIPETLGTSSERLFAKVQGAFCSWRSLSRLLRQGNDTGFSLTRCDMQSHAVVRVDSRVEHATAEDANGAAICRTRR